MSRIIDKKGILEIMYGAAYLSTGAGGPLTTGLRMLKAIEKKVETKLTLLDVNEMDEHDYAIVAAGFGSPDVFLESEFGIEAHYAYTGMKEELLKENKKVTCLYSLEYAGFNTFVPMYVAMLNDIPFLDADANGKAIPSIDISLHKIFNGEISPVVLANEKGDTFICKTEDPLDTDTMELFSRKICEMYGYKIGFSSFAAGKTFIKEKLIPGAISYAGKIGRIILDCKENNSDLLKRIEKETEIREICCGIITDIIKDKNVSYNIGTIVIESNNGKYYIDYKNEILVVRDDSKVIITVPEIISMIDMERYYPITTSEVKVGERISIASSPALGKWWEIPEGYSCYRKLMEQVGYDGVPVRR